MALQRKHLVLGSIVAVAAYAIYTAYSRHYPRTLEISGIVNADEVVVTPAVQAVIDTLAIQEGSVVQAGAVIARLDSAELTAKYQSAMAAAGALRAQLGQAQASSQQTEGETSNALLAATARVAAARADSVRQSVEFDRLHREADRARALATTGAVSSSDLERAVDAESAQRQLLASARSTLQAAVASAAQTKASTWSATSARGGIAATRERLMAAEADAAAAAARLRMTEIRAPVTGVVQVLVARQGELVGPGSPVAVIVPTTRPWVRIAAPETLAGGVRVGDSLAMHLADGTDTWGRVVTKAAEAEFATQHDVSAAEREVRAVALRVALADSVLLARHPVALGTSVTVMLPTRPATRDR